MIVGKASEKDGYIHKKCKVGYTVLSKRQQLQVGSNVAKHLER